MNGINRIPPVQTKFVCIGWHFQWVYLQYPCKTSGIEKKKLKFTFNREFYLVFLPQMVWVPWVCSKWHCARLKYFHCWFDSQLAQLRYFHLWWNIEVYYGLPDVCLDPLVAWVEDILYWLVYWTGDTEKPIILEPHYSIRLHSIIHKWTAKEHLRTCNK